MPEQRRRRDDHPYEMIARLMLGMLFGGAAIAFGLKENTVPMGVFLLAAGAMVKVPLGKVLPR